MRSVFSVMHAGGKMDIIRIEVFIIIIIMIKKKNLCLTCKTKKVLIVFSNKYFAFMWGAGKPQQWLAGLFVSHTGNTVFLCEACVRNAGPCTCIPNGGETWDEGWRRLSFLEKPQILLVHPWLCILSSLVGKQHGVYGVLFFFLNCSFTSIKAIKGAGVHLEWPFWSHTCAVLHKLCHDGNFYL